MVSKYMRHSLLIVLLGGVSLLRAAGPEPSARVPVLLELFTSEGCSSCPPADKLLQRLDREQFIPGADLIVFSEHVDYWNHDGWVDPYSSPEFSKRQEHYASLLDSDVYTPQLIIDGRKQVVGGDYAAVANAVKDSLRASKRSVNLAAKKDGDKLQVHVTVGALPGGRAAAVYLVLAADRARSHVIRGENAGRELEHVAVVQSLVKIGDVSSDSPFEKDVNSTLTGVQRGGDLRVAVFVQETASGRIVGVGQDKL